MTVRAIHGEVHAVPPLDGVAELTPTLLLVLARLPQQERLHKHRLDLFALRAVALQVAVHCVVHRVDD